MCLGAPAAPPSSYPEQRSVSTADSLLNDDERQERPPVPEVADLQLAGGAVPDAAAADDRDLAMVLVTVRLQLSVAEVEDATEVAAPLERRPEMTDDVVAVERVTQPSSEVELIRVSVAVRRIGDNAETRLRPR